ncbi:Auxin response factor 3 [Dichanthelium oligosanthes]|uniref:Auxin response factor 3 n=1 Tax=Dichanthelium oligosanthes TaxID=888268 RepID=A0A1E5UTW6_9POAL|nr:Auxin response factor 3 [Dichanthelium oligosanthes]
MVDGEGEERRPPPAVCPELWHACTGPVVALPRRGNLVVYLPQGHLAAAGGGDVAADLPPHVVCRVADVELCADAATDEVYARLALVAEGEAFGRNVRGGVVEGEDDMEDFDAERKSRMLHIATVSEYIIPYRKFFKSLNHPVCIGVRINFHCQNEDVSERRSGMVVGISEVDPMKWPGSKWRSLLVRWEDGSECNGQDRVSPWEIEIVGGSVSVAHSLSASSSKRTKLCPQGNLDVPTMWNGCTDSVETGRLPRVLQGQELMGFRTHRVTCAPQTAEVAKFQSSDASRFLTNARSCMLSGPTSRLAVQNSGFTYQSVGFNESIGFSEVLQGQEISQAVPMFQGMMSEACSLKGGYGLHSYMRTPAAVNGLSATAQECSLTLSTSPAPQVPSPSPNHMFNQTVASQLGLASKTAGERANGSQPRPFDMPWEAQTRPHHEIPDQISLDQFEARKASAPGDAAKIGSGGREVRKTSCRLFGFSLNEKILPADDDGVKEVSYEAECQNPRMLDLFGYNRSTPNAALPALCAAPFGM